MLSPAARHVIHVQAKQTARSGSFKTNAYEMMLLKLANDKRRLKLIQSKINKAKVKREIVTDYSSWISGVIEADAGIQDDVLMTVMLWHFDAGNSESALNIARYALKHHLVMPEPHKRQTACLIAEESALVQFRRLNNRQPIELSPLITTLELVESEDMPDEVRAQLYKITGYAYRQENHLQQALAYLERAQALDARAGCKKDIERLAKEIKQLDN